MGAGMTTNVNQTVAWVCATVVLIVILVGTFVLVWHGSFVGAEVLPVISGIATAALAIFGVHAGVSVGAKAANKSPSKE